MELIHERVNICNELHMPAQSGNNEVLKYMRRGYTIEAYMELVEKIRALLPGNYRKVPKKDANGIANSEDPN